MRGKHITECGDTARIALYLIYRVMDKLTATKRRKNEAIS